MDQGSGKEHGDHRSQTYLGSEDKSHHNTDNITADTAELEFNRRTFRQAQSYGVVDRHSHVGCKIQRGSQTHNRDAYEQHDQTEEKAAAWKQGGKKPGEKLRDISQKEHIAHRPQTDFFPVHDQRDNKKQKTEYSIESSVAYGASGSKARGPGPGKDPYQRQNS